MTPATAFTESLLLPLDRARTFLFVRALRVAPLRPVLQKKRLRVPLLIFLHAGVALVLSVFAPTLLLVAGPLLLGVPHVLADLRYLVLRPARSPALRRLLLAGSALLFLSRLLEVGGKSSMAQLEFAVAALVMMGATVLGAARLHSARTLSAIALTLLLSAAALAWPREAQLVLSHGHHLVALALWALLFRRARWRAIGVALGVLGVAALLLTTPLAWWGFVHGLEAAFGLHAFAAADTLAPGVGETKLALGIVSSFAFLQSVHYAVWLHAIPQEATPGEGTLTFRMSFRALVADLGWPALALSTLVVLAVPVAGLIAPLRVQTTYLSLSAFHAFLELWALGLSWVGAGEARGASLREPACCF
jgi:hypothetical protein